MTNQCKCFLSLLAPSMNMLALHTPSHMLCCLHTDLHRHIFTHCFHWLCVSSGGVGQANVSIMVSGADNRTTNGLCKPTKVANKSLNSKTIKKKPTTPKTSTTKAIAKTNARIKAAKNVLAPIQTMLVIGTHRSNTTVAPSKTNTTVVPSKTHTTVAPSKTNTANAPPNKSRKRKQTCPKQQLQQVTIIG